MNKSMKIKKINKIAFFNLKGGVGKTTAAVNFAHILAEKYHKKVLLIDCDQQANTSKQYGVFDEGRRYIGDLLLDKGIDICDIIRTTDYPGVDVIPANMGLIRANKAVLMDVMSEQQTRFREHLRKVEEQYDYFIFDCPPNLDMATINALVAADDVIIPIKIDRYSMDGINTVLEAVGSLKVFNPLLHIEGSFINMTVASNLNKLGMEQVGAYSGLRCYKTAVRSTVKVSESTFDAPLLKYDPRATATLDFVDLVDEYLNRKDLNKKEQGE